MNDSYRVVAREELFIGGVLVESRLSYGEALQRDGEIVATDRVADRSLRSACDEEIERTRAIARELAARVRVVVRAASEAGVESIFTIRLRDHAIATTREHALEDFEFLARMCGAPAIAPARAGKIDGAPLLWRNGTAAVLLHEAVGHAAEHGHAPIPLPPWLAVGAPLSLRRESFRDVPLTRMTSVVVEQTDAPFEEPKEPIEILLVSGGAYEPLTGMVTVDVAIAECNGARVPPFSIRASRDHVARSILGAKGPAIRYPGVICSREGQELFVGSWAPLLVTAGLS